MIVFITLSILLCESVTDARRCRIGGLSVNDDIYSKSSEYYTCDSENYNCCAAGCCSKHTQKYLLTFFLLGSSLFIALIYYCFQRCRNKYLKDTHPSPTLSRLTRRFNRTQESATPLVEPSTDASLQTPVTVLTLPNQNSSALPPMTPPPPCAIAMLSPGVLPVDANNRILKDAAEGINKI